MYKEEKSSFQETQSREGEQSLTRRVEPLNKFDNRIKFDFGEKCR